MLNTIQRHTHCSTKYCLRHKQNESKLSCRFNFPFDKCETTKLEFQPVNSKEGKVNYKAVVVTKTNDCRLNNHQRLQLQGWRANCDLQIVIDHHACVEYLAKYATKCEQKSPMMHDVFRSVMSNVDSLSDSEKSIKRLMMRMLGERDFSAQETMHLLLSLKLHSSSFTVVPVSLHGSRKVNTSVSPAAKCTNNSLLDYYAKRKIYVEKVPNVMNINFMQFVSKYKIVKGELRHRSTRFVPKVFPNPKGEHYAFYIANINF